VSFQVWLTLLPRLKQSMLSPIKSYRYFLPYYQLIFHFLVAHLSAVGSRFDPSRRQTIIHWVNLGCNVNNISMVGQVPAMLPRFAFITYQTDFCVMFDVFLHLISDRRCTSEIILNFNSTCALFICFKVCNLRVGLG